MGSRAIYCVWAVFLVLASMQTGVYGGSGYAIEFDGVDDYVDVNSLDYAFEDGDTFTIELWGKWFDDTRSLCVRRYSLQRSRFRTRGTVSLSVNTGISNTEWNHVAVVYDGSGGTKVVTVYVNGAQSATTSTTGSPLSSYEGDTLRFGMTHHSGGQYSHCIFDEVRIWNIARALSAIQADMKRGLNGNEPGLVGYWPLDDGEGTTAADLSPSGNNGTLVGASWTTDTSPVVPAQLPVLARNPSPAGGAVDVPRDVILGWTPGNATCKHDVYFGASSSDVSDAGRTNPLNVLARQAQDANTYDPPGRLEFGTTYYWRVDEVNPVDSTIAKGKTWSFTTEPVLYSMANITATASATKQGLSPQNTVDNSGMNDSEQHSMLDTTMWLSAKDAPAPTWIQYEFDGTYKLHEMRVWNYNISVESIAGLGVKDATVEYSVNGTDWTSLGDKQFAQAPGTDGYASNTTVSFGGVAAKFVRLTIKSNWGDRGIVQYGLSEVRFYYVPAQPRQPNPASGATGVNPDVVLSWRSGREAAAHEVYLSTDSQAVADSIALAGKPSQPRYTPSGLELNKTYYWKVVEVNEAASPSAWPGNVWSFSTLSFFIIDDFERYTDDSPNRVFQTWIDGWGFSEDSYFPKGNPGNSTGSMVGYDPEAGATMEKTIIHGGRQAMPVEYNNVESPYYSEATRTFDTPQDWTVYASDTLQVFFRGNPIGFEEKAGTITMSAAGADIFGTADEFTYVYKSLSGNGSITVRVDSVEQTDVWAKAGVMIRDNLGADSKNGMAYVTPDGRVGWQYRQQLMGTSDSTRSDPGAITLPHWLRLTRDGDTITAAHSSDGIKWEPMVEPTDAASPSSLSIPMTTSIFVGLALTSHAAGVGCTAQFSSVATSGGAGGAWKFAEIGVDHLLNDRAGLYVALEDSAGRTGIVTHPDPDATLLDTWQAWDIPLADFRKAGVDTKGIKKMVVGVGDRKNPSPGATGLIFIDDIGFGRPVSGE